ncbi:MAG: hypothetical protein CL949_00440, partial [Erythrobacter sp.]|nr:hypothetical protein [Erythrobacter sp.]
MFGSKSNAVELADTAVMDRGLSADEKFGSDQVYLSDAELRFGHMLIEKGFVTQDQCIAAVWEASETSAGLGETLVKQHVMQQKTLIALQEDFDSGQISSAVQYNVPVDDVTLLHEEKVVLFGMSSHSLYLGCLGNERRVRSHFVREFPDKVLRFIPVKPAQVSQFLERTDRLPRKTLERNGGGRLEITRYIPRSVSDGDVLDLIVNVAGVRGGSDIHVEPKATSYTVFIRINRIRKIVHEGSITQYNALRAQVKDRARMDQSQMRRPQDGAYSQEIMGRMFDLRVATFPMNGGQEKIVIRLLDPDKAAKRLVDLGITKTDDWRAACSYSHGLILVAGKTNSGKSTTLIASLREKDRIGQSIYTIEDPVEHQVDFLTQMAVNRSESVQLDFKTGTRAMMRGDPEIILIGETRDTETASAAAQAAESGHLVFTTIHAGTVRETVSRLKSFGVDEAELRPMLRGILAQRLIRTLCQYCRGAKCPHCLHTGYDGMTVISEMGFFPSERHFDRMMNGEIFWDPMVKDALHKLELGITDEKEVYRVFRSEIDYLPPEYEGVEELAEHVKEVIAGRKE